MLTVLNFSGGVQSSTLALMSIRGEIEPPDVFVVANPGMENSLTYKYVDWVFEQARSVGIRCIKAPGPNLYEDLLSFKADGLHRIDNPPLWVKKSNGYGRALQKCTAKYKIAPMNRAIRQVLFELFGCSVTTKRLPEGIVDRWIGFAADEQHRIPKTKSLPLMEYACSVDELFCYSDSRKQTDPKYTTFRYPLIEMGLDKQGCINWFNDRNLPIPPRSVCNACPFNGLATLKEMYLNRPDDWMQAVRVDDEIRDCSSVGLTEGPCFVSSTLKPIRQLPELNFLQSEGTEDDDSYSCDSGYCFL